MSQFIKSFFENKLAFSFCHTFNINATKNYIFFNKYYANKLPETTRYLNKHNQICLLLIFIFLAKI